MSTATTSGMNVQGGQARPQQLTDSRDNLTLGERIGSTGDVSRKASPAPNAVNTPTEGMTTDATVGPITVKQVDYKTITGSNPGDHRGPREAAGDVTAKFKNQGNPRTQMEQQKSSRFDSDAAVFTSSTSGSEGERA